MNGELVRLVMAGGEVMARGQQTQGGVLFELGALVPSIAVGLLFWFVIRAIMRADRTERQAEREAEAQLRAEHRERAREGPHDRLARPAQAARAEREERSPDPASHEGSARSRHENLQL